MLTTTVMAAGSKVMIAPAMNVNMYMNPILQNNLKILRDYGYKIIEPAVGYLACGDTGAGKMPEPETLYQFILREIACEKDLAGLKIMVTAGPTREALDPVRFITNHSTGKMGYAIARMAMLRGAEVTLVSGPVSLAPVPFVRIIDVTSAQDMFEAVRDNLEDQDALIKAAAVADYRPAVVSDEKVKKSDGDMSISLERTQDILQYVSAHRRPNQVICGFSMETMNMIENSRKKLKKKNLDMIIANNLKEKGAGFGTDTNRVTIISKEGERELELLTKEEVADEILNEILARKSSGGMNGL
jgi:phosphopantothenoylcysteine decarboxylase/phosphopantothenate--cysteine ligase